MVKIDPNTKLIIKRIEKSNLVYRNKLLAITQNRINLLSRFIDKGGKTKIFVDLGCGNGEFACKLSKEKALSNENVVVIGIDEHPWITLDDYRKNEKFICLPYKFKVINGLLDSTYKLLAHSVERTFLIFPIHQNSIIEEIKLWNNISVPGGELHIRTEFPELLVNLTRKPSTYKRIAFDKEAERILSPFTNIAHDAHLPVIRFGIK